MHNTYINRMRIEEVEHVVDPHDGANDGSNSVCHNIDFRDVQSQDGQESWRGQAEGCYRVFIEKCSGFQSKAPWLVNGQR